MDNHRDFGQDDHSDILSTDSTDSTDSADSADNYAQDEAIMDDNHGFGTDERRMHVRAYNHWVMLLGDKSFPSVDDLDLETMGDFVPNSVLLDFTAGIENPGISHIGSAVADESGIDSDVQYVSQIPGRSLLSRITDHYMEILANQAPIGFEAEFVNQLGKTIMYRGILLPFSSDDDTIDFVFGVINWKMLADKVSTDELMLEVEQALVADNTLKPDPSIWDSDVHNDAHDDVAELPDVAFGNSYEQEKKHLPLSVSPNPSRDNGDHGASQVRHGLAFSASVSSELLSEDQPDRNEDTSISNDDDGFCALDEDAGLTQWLEVARQEADNAARSEVRSRGALYRAIGLAYDVSLVAQREPQALAEALENANIVAQERAPMTPIVKLVFGAGYDKTRLTEYATALSHAHRQSLPMGSLPEFLDRHIGGLKAVVREERQLRRPADNGLAPVDALEQAYQKLRQAEAQAIDAICFDDAEFGVLVVRRNDAGELVVAAASANSKITDIVVRKLA